MEKNNDGKALFIQRFLAYFIDIFIISIVASLIASPFVDSKSINKLNKSSTEVVEKYMTGEINEKTYFTEAMSISYQMAKKNGISSLIIIFLSILYFVVYQFYNNGQTLGKKLFKIRVISEDGELSMNQMIFRALIIDSILIQMLVMAFMIFASQYVYIYTTSILQMIQYGVILVSGLMVMFSKTGKGLHDIVTRTKVIQKNM